jgi:hypothetical protein
MNISQVLGLLRHTATALGGAALTYPDPNVKLAGALLLALGGITSIVSNSDTPPLVPLTIPPLTAGEVPQVPASPVQQKAPVVSSQVVSLLVVGLLAAISLGAVGCTTTGAIAQQDVVAAITTPVTTDLVIPLLLKNPKLEPVLTAISEGIDTVFNTGTVTPVEINAFVNALSVKYPQLDAADKLLIVSTVQQILTVYTTTTGKALVDATDPTAKALLNAFKAGIDQGIADFHALEPAPAS